MYRNRNFLLKEHLFYRVTSQITNLNRHLRLCSLMDLVTYAVNAFSQEL